MVGGGTMILNTLKAVVETGRPGAMIRFLYAVVFPVVTALTPGKARYSPDKWPMKE
jgi:hypothetical protein